MSDPNRIKEIFLLAVEETDPTARDAFLDRACQDDRSMRKQVDLLLQFHNPGTSFLAAPASTTASAPELASALAALEDSTTAEDDNSDDPEIMLRLLLQPSSRSGSLGRIGSFEILEVLGKGAFGIVFRAYDDALQRMAAIKVLTPRIAATSPARKRFLREARSSAKVRHANVIQVYSVEESPLPYLVMEFVPGETLQQRIDRTGPLDTAEVVAIGRQVALGLAAAHAQGLIHRDIKPSNILLEGLHVKITDFGLARAADDASLTQSGTIAGTPMFMSPEQAGGAVIDQRADLFSLGSVLYTMCSGRPPFRANNTLAVLKRVAEDTPRPIRDIIPEVPLWMCEIISRLHAKKPEGRIATAKEVADLLERGPSLVQSADTLVPAAVSPVQSPAQQVQSPAKPRRRSGAWSIGAAALLLLVGLGVAEAFEVTDIRSAVIRLMSPDGTLVVEVDDPGVSVSIEGSELVITGAGPKEIRLRPGRYAVEARKDGKVVTRELVTVATNGRQIVRVTQEPAPPLGRPVAQKLPEKKADPANKDVAAWERSVADMPHVDRLQAISARLKEANPGYSGRVEPIAAQFQMSLIGDELRDLSPVRGMRELSGLHVHALNVESIEPLRGLKLTHLNLTGTGVSDLSPLSGEPLQHLGLVGSRNLTDLTPLKNLPLVGLTIAQTPIVDLSPLKGMKLQGLNFNHCPVSDLSPLREVPLLTLDMALTKVTDLSPLKGMALVTLSCDGCDLTDAALDSIKGCATLKRVVLTRTKVTAAGIDQLKAALPKCRIEWDGGVIEESR